MRSAGPLAFTLALAGCFAPPFPDAPDTGAGHGGHGGGRATDDHHDPALDAAQGIRLSGACFEVAVPGDAETSWIHGALVEPLTGAAATLVVLIPGGASHAHVFDGEHFGYGRDSGTTLPRALARAGHAALAIDRLGLGLSAYPGHGGRLTGEVQDAHVAAVVDQLRAGMFTRVEAPEGACPAAGAPGRAHERIVLAGQSLGGTLAMRHAVGGQGGADGYVVLGMTTQPLGARASPDPVASPPLVGRCFTEQAGKVASTGYFETLCPGPDGLALGCVDVWMWPPAADPAILRAFCANDQIHAEPVGSVTMFQQAANEHLVARIPQASGAPIHFVFGEHDCVTNDGDACDDPSKAREEIRRWQAACPCDVSGTIVPHVGHVFQFHSDHARVNEDVLDWLVASGLGPGGAEASTT